MGGESSDEITTDIGKVSQRKMASESRFPKKMMNDIATFEALGFRFGREIDKTICGGRISQRLDYSPHQPLHVV
jgi:hypothetical protein